jgi:hypothetical protein
MFTATKGRLLTTWTTISFDSHHCGTAHELYFHLSSVYPCPWCSHLSWWQSHYDLWHHYYNFQNSIAVYFWQCFEILRPICKRVMDSSLYHLVQGQPTCSNTASILLTAFFPTVLFLWHTSGCWEADVLLFLVSHLIIIQQSFSNDVFYYNICIN